MDHITAGRIVKGRYFQSFYHIRIIKADGNSLIGSDISVYDTSNCIIHATEEKKVVVQGLDGYIVAEKGDTLLVCKLSEEQRIRQFAGE